VEVAADGDRVTGLADGADPLPRPDPLADVDHGRARKVGVEVAAVLTFAVDQQVVAVEDRVIAGPQHSAVACGDQLGAAGGDDVEAFMGAAAAAGGTEFADRAAGSVRALDREDVGVVGNRPVGAGDLGGGWSGEGREEEKGEKGRALQWCSMTRSTMLYSFASSALMK
jgi:hypothetical protein